MDETRRPAVVFSHAQVGRHIAVLPPHGAIRSSAAIKGKPKPQPTLTILKHLETVSPSLPELRSNTLPYRRRRSRGTSRRRRHTVRPPPDSLSSPYPLLRHLVTLPNSSRPLFCRSRARKITPATDLRLRPLCRHDREHQAASPPNNRRNRTAILPGS
jgi:hypothetical protein